VPILAAWLTIPDFMDIIQTIDSDTFFWTFVFGVLWGIGGLTFGLAMRYLGMSLGMSIALSLCSIFGALVPPIYRELAGVDGDTISHIAGSTGGPVSVLNNKMLANSDFFMSAFPAEYGNSMSGIFDLKLRNGNANGHEFTGQFGFLGTEFLAEGPMGKNNRSSYMVMGRYSTLSLFQKLGIQLGTDAVPVYGDAAFKFNWLSKKGGSLSFFGIGGKSNIAIMISEQTQYSEEFYGEGDRDQYFGTSMGVTGLNYKKPLSEKTFINATLALSYEEQNANHDYLFRTIEADNITIRIDSMKPLMAYTFNATKGSAFFSINHKFNNQLLLKAGINADAFFMTQLDSARLIVTDEDFVRRWDYQGSAMLIQPFFQFKYKTYIKAAIQIHFR
jgi:hypothetical protein